LTYESFLEKKKIQILSTGFDIETEDLNQMLFDFQKDIVRWALKKGKACIFADCGSGKTPMQLEWANRVHEYTGGNVLILAPLAVAEQTKREGDKFGIPVNVCRSQADVKPGINITNYEMLPHFVTSEFIGVVLDESSVLKHFESKTRTQIIDNFAQTEYKLACTATPAPNDYMELGNHAEFVGVMTRTEMLAMYFVHDGGETAKWRLKGHAEDVFWKWLTTWAIVIQNPKDLEYDDVGYDLPELNLHEEVIWTGEEVILANTLTERRDARKDTLEERCQRAADIANMFDDQVLIWCDLNAESELLHKLIYDSVEVKGSDKPEHKSNAMIGFSKGEVKALVTKPSIAGFGMNWQNCCKMIFVGLSDSYEAYYQAIRRCWRFGQKNNVDVYVVVSDREGSVRENILRKENDAKKMTAEMVKYTKEILTEEIHNTSRVVSVYDANTIMKLPYWRELIA